ncbi:hypothetical protein [Sporomusa sp.]|uniref:hypothetical protein n=1 Tax=Sporomusa sp. TaxID=2078658 RepID=UPI002B99DE7D|nr:hypothetical protein [Sporomusa sp.]HWR42268.1 hypothetical protein [Sporomusa sp.]
MYNQANQSIEVQKSRNFALIGEQGAAIFKTPEELYHALPFCKSVCCNVFAHEELQLLMFIVHQYHPYYTFIDDKANLSPLKIPASACYFAVQNQELLEADRNNSQGDLCVNQTNVSPLVGYPSFWGVTGLNGFCIVNGSEQLIAAVSDPSFLVAPHACCFFSDINGAYHWARHDYIRRFYRHYPATQEMISLPFNCNPENQPVYIDPAFQEREERWRNNNSFECFNDLYKFGF